jgi:hypothetical protein
MQSPKLIRLGLEEEESDDSSMDSGLEETFDTGPEEQSCSSCGNSVRADRMGNYEPKFIYALGHVEPRFPTLGIEKEFAQASGMIDAEGLTDQQLLHEVLKHNLYLARQMCWVFSIEGLDTYILQPQYTADYDLLIEATRSNPNPKDVDVVIGIQGPLAPPAMCNGLVAPIVHFDQLYSFDRDSLLNSLVRPKEIPEERFKSSNEELFDRLKQVTDNAGALDEHRALNYLLVRYPAIYTLTADQFGRNASLTAVNVQPSILSSSRRIVEVVFSFTNRKTDVIEKYFVRVDVTEEFPFLVTKLSSTFDR